MVPYMFSDHFQRSPSIQILGTFVKLRKATSSFYMSLCLSAWEKAAHTGRIFIKFDI